MSPSPSSAASRRASVEDRIVAAEVALEERLPSVARLFLAGIEAPALTAATTIVRGRFLRAMRASRVGTPV